VKSYVNVVRYARRGLCDRCIALLRDPDSENKNSYLLVSLGPGVHSAPSRNEHQKQKNNVSGSRVRPVCRAGNLPPSLRLLSKNVRSRTSHNLIGLYCLLRRYSFLALRLYSLRHLVKCSEDARLFINLLVVSGFALGCSQ
jgi:hypothetical protein